VPGGQPFGLGPAGVAVAAHSIASVYLRPWRRSAYRRADPRLPHRMVPAYPPFGAFGFTTYGIRSRRCSLSAGLHFMQMSK
jgi:hypothetical protein